METRTVKNPIMKTKTIQHSSDCFREIPYAFGNISSVITDHAEFQRPEGAQDGIVRSIPGQAHWPSPPSTLGLTRHLLATAAASPSHILTYVFTLTSHDHKSRSTPTQHVNLALAASITNLLVFVSSTPARQTPFHGVLFTSPRLRVSASTLLGLGASFLGASSPSRTHVVRYLIVLVLLLHQAAAGRRRHLRRRWHRLEIRIQVQHTEAPECE